MKYDRQMIFNILKLSEIEKTTLRYYETVQKQYEKYKQCIYMPINRNTSYLRPQTIRGTHGISGLRRLLKLLKLDYNDLNELDFQSLIFICMRFDKNNLNKNLRFLYSLDAEHNLCNDFYHLLDVLKHYWIIKRVKTA